MKSKKKKIIVENIFKIRIKIFGNSKKMLLDNWGEFDKQEFRDFWKNLNVKIKTTAVEGPWSNGMV